MNSQRTQTIHNGNQAYIHGATHYLYVYHADQVSIKTIHYLNMKGEEIAQYHQQLGLTIHSCPQPLAHHNRVNSIGPFPLTFK